jgi:glycerate-2-kinase
MITVKNKEKIIGNGVTRLDRKARAFALRSLESALKAVDPKQLIKSRLFLKNSMLKIDMYSFDLAKFQNVYVIGGGKASGAMAEILEQFLGEYLRGGLVNIPREIEHKTEIIELHKASHPIPDESGVKGTRQMLKIAEEARSEDLIICLISGGGSSLMPDPRREITIDDKKEITTALLRCGATISEINTVRKHISNFKGGWLAKKAYPATVLNLILSDVVGDPLDFIASGPTVPDTTTFSDAINVMKKYRLWKRTPESIQKVLLDGEKGLIPETPKIGDKVFEKVYNVVVGNNRSASLAACESLRSANLNSLLLTSTLEGEAKQVGSILASIVHEVSASGNPIPAPSGIVIGGETTVEVTGKGMGGRNQEIALAAALKIEGLEGVVIASMSTDGVDGPTDAAGAIADGKTIYRAAKMKMNPEDFLDDNDSYHLFSSLGDLILTGPTGTNVNDISIIVVL